jgi:hypothetical protein
VPVWSFRGAKVEFKASPQHHLRTGDWKSGRPRSGRSALCKPDLVDAIRKAEINLTLSYADGGSLRDRAM